MKSHSASSPVLLSSLPTRGAWIEIIQEDGYTQPIVGRSPHGERGLKLGIMRGSANYVAVAPYTGSVD